MIFAIALAVLGFFPIILDGISYLLFQSALSYPNLFTLTLVFFIYCIYVFNGRDEFIKRYSVTEIDDLKDGVDFTRVRFFAPLLQVDIQFDSPSQLHGWLANTKSG